MTKLALVINQRRCIGCQACALSCKMSNNVPDGMMWNRVLSVNTDHIDGAQGTYPNLTREYLPIACQHCEDPACMKVCPTGATYKDDTGRVQIDYDKCIGCRMCMAACPYNARTFNWNEPVRQVGFDYGDREVPARGKGIMEKCTLCKERGDRGEEPMCVVNCPMRARIYGDLDDPNSEASRAVRENAAYVLLPEEGTHPQVHYIK
ncbi:MAG: 4Fe-4S dicluster domain-containing protein [Eggerthellaceae bacterium]|nr:4Fe-4S dicluster domain-containing protein [Eggerthellaceae bacterium]